MEIFNHFKRTHQVFKGGPTKIDLFCQVSQFALGGRNLATEIVSRGGLYPKDLNFRGVTEELLVPNHATVNVEKEERSKTFGTYLLAFSVCHFISMFFPIFQSDVNGYCYFSMS